MVDFVHETAEKSATHFGGATRCGIVYSIVAVEWVMSGDESNDQKK